jgi:hypothetical protein
MEAMDGSQPAEIRRVAGRLPPFCAERPAVWFAQAEAQFSLASISSERTTFHYIISQLDQRYAAEVEDIISSPPQQDPYTELLKRLSLSREQRAHRILTLDEMGDRKPSPRPEPAGLLPASHLDQSDCRKNACHSCLPSRGRAGRRGLLR